MLSSLLVLGTHAPRSFTYNKVLDVVMGFALVYSLFSHKVVGCICSLCSCSYTRMCLCLQIPWKNLYNEPVIATIDGLHLIVVPNKGVVYNEEKVGRCCQDCVW